MFTMRNNLISNIVGFALEADYVITTPSYIIVGKNLKEKRYELADPALRNFMARNLQRAYQEAQNDKHESQGQQAGA